MGIVIRTEHLSKEYRLGVFNHGMLYKDMQSWFARKLGKPDPHSKIGADHFSDQADRFWALKDVNFDIEQGARVGIIGKNGAGKSTLLKILSRITTPTEGSAKIKGRIASLLEIGTGFHAELTGRENIYLNGAILGMKKRQIDRKLDAIIDFSGIESHIDTPVKRYSSGMFVRLAFAVAAHLDSDILLADEVLAVGDAEFQKKALGKMQDLSTGQGRTVLFVSHNMGMVKQLCTTGIVLANGTLTDRGNIDSVMLHYLSKANSKSDLKERNDRIGNGNFRFTSLSFFDKDWNQITDILTGEILRIRMNYEITNSIDLTRIIVALNFRDEFQQTILSFVSDEMGASIVPNADKSITLEIPRLLLRGGTYSIRLFASYGTTDVEDYCDDVEDAAYLNVISSDYWKSGIMIRSAKSALLDGAFIL